MSWVATAVIGGAIIGGVASNSAADKAAKGQDKALAASSAGTAQARGDITRLFGAADKESDLGFKEARNFLEGAFPRQIEPFKTGNIAAQEQLARGLPQIQNAILGNQVDLSGFQARDIPFRSLPQQQPVAPVSTNQPVVGGNQSPLAGGNNFGGTVLDAATLANLNTPGFDANNFNFEGEMGAFI